MRGRTHRKDANHKPFSMWLESYGWLVFDTHNLSGFCDAIAIKAGRVVFIEYKAGRTPKERALKVHQAALQRALRFHGAEAVTVASVEDLAYFERPITDDRSFHERSRTQERT